jgi:bifunctional non-homologous end joining protein LigD
MPYPKAKRPPVGVKGPNPGFIAPALAASIGRVPKGDRWIHEVKFDGYRVQVHIANEAIKVFTRNGHDWTKQFSKIAHDAWHLNTKSAIIDGEVVVPAADGTTDFATLQKELRGKSTKLVLYAFDLLYLDGYDLRRAPLAERKSLLEKLIQKSDILYSRGFETEGQEFFETACGMGLEGIVSKVRDSRYSSGRTDSWLKLTCRQRETLPIVGYALKGDRFDGLYVGRRTGDELLYAGKIDHGFDADTVRDVRKRLTPLVQKAQAFSRTIKKAQAVWVRPTMLAEVEYRAKSTEGKLRHPIFKGFREDL